MCVGEADSAGCQAVEVGRRNMRLASGMQRHIVEVIDNDRLIGGLYGVKLGKIFFGESMFSMTSNASKVALKALCELGAPGGLNLIDCQMPNEHLASLGMTLISRENFEMELKNSITVGDIGRGPTLASDYVSSTLDAQLRAFREQT